VRASRAIAAGAIALVIGLAIVLSEHQPQRTGVDGVPPNAFVDRLLAHQSACQTSTVPAQTRAVGLYVGVYGAPGPPLTLTLTGGGTVLRRVHARGGYQGGALRIAIPVLERETADASVCVEDSGSSRVALAGVSTSGPASTLDGRGHATALELSFYGPTTTDWGLAPTVARRVGLLDFGGTGSWLLWTLIAVMTAVAATAIGLIAHEVRQ
jgi:hypothetical protein